MRRYEPKFSVKARCFICDFWGLILLGVILLIAAILLRDYWLPLLTGTPPAQVEPQIIATSEVNTVLPTEQSTPTIEPWKTFENTQLGYQFQYPADWYVSSMTIQTEGFSTAGSLLTDVENSGNPQLIAPGETARMLVISYQKDERELRQRIVQDFNWVNAELLDGELGGKAAILTQPFDSPGISEEQQLVWVERAKDIIVIWIQYQPGAGIEDTFQKILDSFGWVD